MNTGILVKISDDVFDGLHPNGINEGYTTRGTFSFLPEVNNSFNIGRLFTSVVKEIVNKTETEILFKTKNSTYKLTIEE